MNILNDFFTFKKYNLHQIVSAQKESVVKSIQKEKSELVNNK